MSAVESDERTRRLDAVLEDLAPRGVRHGVRSIDERDLEGLHPAEAVAVRSAAAVRRNEFASGRALLRTLIGRDVPIPIGDDRRPVLPTGITGSIAHDRHVVVGAVASTTVTRGLGIDLEPAVALEPDLARIVLRPDDEIDDPLVAFVLKEAAYKAWSNAGGRMLEHHDVRVAAAHREASHCTFTATVVADRVVLEGRFAQAGDAWVAVAFIEP